MLFFILARVFITILFCTIMPHQNGTPYASSAFVWVAWSNQTGYSSNGFVFLASMLNGAYPVGTPDCVSHLAEEITHPNRNVLLAIAAQMGIGFFTTFFYMIAIFYAIIDLDEVLDAPYFPLAQIYAGDFHPWWNHWSASSDIMSHFLHHYRMLQNSRPLSLDVIPRRSGPILRNVGCHFSSLQEPLQRNPRLWLILSHPRSHLCRIYYSI